MRLGGPVFEKYKNPDEWIAVLQRAGYSAAYCPLEGSQTDDIIQAYKKAAESADIVIAEVGAWSNPMSPDERTRSEAITKCQEQLALADRIAARCCVNVSGSRGEQWAGPHPDNLTDDTFDLIVETVRNIIDAVKPTRTCYALETMPWMYPDSADSYLKLIRAVDREQFAAHFDPVNLIYSPQRFYNNDSLIRDCFNKLGPYIRSCHAKDVDMEEKFITHLNEVRPGLGKLRYDVFLQELNKLEPDVPLMVEHLTTEEKYAQAVDYIRSVARELKIKIK